MAETTGADAAAKKVVMVTGGTGLVGCGIKEFVESDPEVGLFFFLAAKSPFLSGPLYTRNSKSRTNRTNRTNRVAQQSVQIAVNR